nr:MAG TPA: hypothetical protein [Caudoviricetes sp.]
MPSVVRCGAFYVSTEVRGLLTAGGFFLFTPQNLVFYRFLATDQFVHGLLAFGSERFELPEFPCVFLRVGTVGEYRDLRVDRVPLSDQPCDKLAPAVLVGDVFRLDDRRAVLHVSRVGIALDRVLVFRHVKGCRLFVQIEQIMPVVILDKCVPFGVVCCFHSFLVFTLGR